MGLIISSISPHPRFAIFLGFINFGFDILVPFRVELGGYQKRFIILKSKHSSWQLFV